MADILRPDNKPSFDFLRGVLAEQLSPTEKVQTGLSDPYRFVPIGNIVTFIECMDDEVIAEGPAETGKTLAALNKLHRTAFRYAGSQLSIIRKTYKSMVGSVLMTYENKVIGLNSQVRAYGGSKPSWYDYPNGSRIWVDGMDEPTRILSSERDIIYVNQAEELSLQEWETLSTRVTGRAGNIPNPQLLGDCNPGPPTHWIKSRAKQSNLTLIQTGHKDNPTLWDVKNEAWTEQGERTLRKLSKLTGTMRLRLLNGMWAQPEGAIYNMFLEERHKVEAFYPNPLWPRVVGIDPIGANIAAVWLAFDPQQGLLNVYREYSEPFGMSTPQHVDNILGLSRGETIFAWVAGAVAERQARVDLTAYGIPAISPPISDVWAGVDRIRQLLYDCKLVIHDSCPGLLSEIGAYSRSMDPKTGVVTNEIANKESYHLLDAMRYAVAWLTTPVEERSDIVYAPIHIGLEY